ncbi:MAG TPA: nucleoside triphosphate pyrophosphohydrolase [Acidimicrobiia bacterium]|nr:nucleoside triphosphate pyrophosphohydrolase [Acidimicrobiia bacterium]
MTAPSIVIAGLGPGSWDSIPKQTRDLLLDPDRSVIVRTLSHPAAERLAELRDIVSCDDLYQASDNFDRVYEAITDRVMASAISRPTVYAVPGSPTVGEFAASLIRQAATAAGVKVEMMAAESFLDAVLTAIAYDPLDRGLRLINGHRLPTPLVIDCPTVIAHLDVPMVLSDVLVSLQRVLPEDTTASLIVDVGDEAFRVVSAPLYDLDPAMAGLRTSMFLDPEPGGLVGVVQTMWRLREECPWDRTQTHLSLVKNLIEECYELIEALTANKDGTAYGAVEDELGDVLLQVLFHAAIARQEGAFDIDDVAENLRQKLVRRHPHVFGTVEAESPDQVKANWDLIKEQERGKPNDSIMDGVPPGMPALERAAKLQRRAASVGFDWENLHGVVDKTREELGELEEVLASPDRAAEEIGDLLFSLVNLARWVEVDPEVALRGAIQRFVSRVRLVEAEGPIEGLTAQEMDERWERAKAQFPE